MRLQPRKDYEKNIMEPSLLQLPRNTHCHLTVDETKLEPGKIEGLGLPNIKALAELIEQQQVTYDF